MKSIRFPDKEMREKFFRNPVLKNYIETTENQSETNDLGFADGETSFFKSSQLTNLGIFRFYAETYLKQHPLIDENQIVIVRHRAPEGHGLPLQVYVYSKKPGTVPYENLQSEIFEHLLAIMNEFGLKVYQQPTGEDLLALSKGN
jgi:miniconductance mechanosensitive channel